MSPFQLKTDPDWGRTRYERDNSCVATLKILVTKLLVIGSSHTDKSRLQRTIQNHTSTHEQHSDNCPQWQHVRTIVYYTPTQTWQRLIYIHIFHCIFSILFFYFFFFFSTGISLSLTFSDSLFELVLGRGECAHMRIDRHNPDVPIPWSSGLRSHNSVVDPWTQTGNNS